jgi:hypothetical protein
MTGQTDRLQALLVRVQENRQQPRGGNTRAYQAPPAVQEAPVVHRAQPAPREVPQPVYAAAAQAPAAQPAFGERTQPRSADPRGAKAAATPLEMAVEGRLSAPIHAPANTPPQAPAQSHAHAPPQRAHAQAAAPAAPVSREGVVLVEAQVPQPTRPIAQVVSMNPPSLAATFGELLRRSLSLRPR